MNRLYGPTLPATVTVLPNQPGFDWNKVRALPQVESVSRFAVSFGSTVENAPGAETQFPFLDSSMTRTIERPVVLAGLYNPAARTRSSSPPVSPAPSTSTRGIT